MEISEWRIANSEWKGDGEAGEESLFATHHSPVAGDIVAIARTWIGTPYVHQASLKGVGCDCLGLIRGIWRELYGEEPEDVPPYSMDWAEATGAETLYMALSRHARSIPPSALAPGDIALFRMLPRGPAKHCGVIGQMPTQPRDSPPPGREVDALAQSGNASGGGGCHLRFAPHPICLSTPCFDRSTSPRWGR